MADHIPLIIAGEAHNLRESLAALKETALLVSDLDDVYHKLVASSAKTTDHGEETYRAFLAVIQLHAVCRRQLTVAALTLFRGHQSDPTLHTRIAIDAAAAAWRISKHHELAIPWLGACTDSLSYEKYRKLFHAKKLFPWRKDDPDYHPHFVALRKNYELFSKLVHVSIYGVAGRAAISSEDDILAIALRFCDLPDGRALISGLFLILDTHRRIVNVLAHALEKCGSSVGPDWYNEFTTVLERLERHRDKMRPIVVARLGEE